MITILTSPKAFSGHFGRIQENALRSWKRIAPDVDVVLFGESPGAERIARLYDCRHVTDVKSTELGLPYFDAIMEWAELNARFDTYVYLNADIMLPPYFAARLPNAHWLNYVGVGQRIDLHEGVFMEEAVIDWDSRVSSLISSGDAHVADPFYADYFVFKRGGLVWVKPLIIGRGGYDNAIIAHVLRSNRIPLIDLTPVQRVLHQYHDYSHVKGGRAAAYAGVDSRLNRKNYDIWHVVPGIPAAEFILTPEGLVQKDMRHRPLCYLGELVRYKLGWKYTSYVLRLVVRLSEFCARCRFIAK